MPAGCYYRQILQSLVIIELVSIRLLLLIGSDLTMGDS